MDSENPARAKKFWSPKLEVTTHLLLSNVNGFDGDIKMVFKMWLSCLAPLVGDCPGPVNDLCLTGKVSLRKTEFWRRTVYYFPQTFCMTQGFAAW